MTDRQMHEKRKHLLNSIKILIISISDSINSRNAAFPSTPHGTYKLYSMHKNWTKSNLLYLTVDWWHGLQDSSFLLLFYFPQVLSANVSKVKWCIYIAPFPCNMLKGALQWSVYPQWAGSIYRRLWQPLQIDPCMLVLILLTPGGWKAEWTLAGKKVTQIFNPRPGRESNRGPQDWEAEILTPAPTPPL